MTARNDFNGTVLDWLADEAGHGSPGYLDEILARTTRTRQRPAWSSLERWLPVSATVRAHVAPVPRQVWFIALLAAIALAATLIILAGVGQPSIPRLLGVANGKIVFVDGDRLRSADANGTLGPPILDIPDGADQLAFSPNGARLAFRTLDALAPSIMTVDPDGAHPVVVMMGPSLTAAGRIAWSPDSRRIAFMSTIGAVGTLSVAEADGSHVSQLALRSGGSNPAWSPDGQWIAFLSGRADGSVALNVIHPDGSAETTLSTSPVNADGFAWSPDPGTLRLAYVSTEVPTRSSSRGPAVSRSFIQVYGLASFKDTSVTEVSPLDPLMPAWSPNGAAISWWEDRGTRVIGVADALAHHLGDATPWTLFPPNESGCLPPPGVTAKVLCGPAQWSPDSQWLIGLDGSGSAVVIDRSDGTPVSREITLDRRPADGSAFSGGQVAWQAVAP